jgi:hypothetical protein
MSGTTFEEAIEEIRHLCQMRLEAAGTTSAPEISAYDKERYDLVTEHSSMEALQSG